MNNVSLAKGKAMSRSASNRRRARLSLRRVAGVSRPRPSSGPVPVPVGVLRPVNRLLHVKSADPSPDVAVSSLTAALTCDSMSLKQFPAPSRKKNQPGNSVAPRMLATVFDPTVAWDVVERRKEKIRHYVDLGGFGNIDRRKAEHIAQASGIRISKGFSVAKAIDSYRKTKFREMQAYLAFLVVFTINTYYYGDFEHANQIKSSLETALFETQYLASESGKFIKFAEVHSASDFWNYLINAFSAGFFSANGECSGKCSDNQGLENLMKYNSLVQPIRIRQLRVNAFSAEECDIAVDMLVSGADFRCWPTYSRDNENKSAIQGWPKGTMIQYASAEQLRTEAYGIGATTTFDGGGFVLDIPLGASPEYVSDLFQHLQTIQWTDLSTRAIFIDICVYNPSFEFFTSIRLLFEFLPFGDIRASKFVGVFQAGPVPGVLIDIVLYYMDFVIYFILLLFAVWDFQRISKVGWVYFRNFWNWVSMLNYVIFSFTFVQKQLYLSLEPIQAYSGSPLPINGTSSVFDFTVIAHQYTTISVLVGYSALLCWARILSYMRYFNRDLSLLVSTVGNCALDTTIWFSVIVIVIFIYAQAFFVAFGPSVDGFNTLAQSMGTMCEWLFHRVNAAEIIGVDEGVASLLFISFQAIYSLLLFNLLWIVIIRSYKDVRGEGVDDPIAVEIRKLVISRIRLWQSFLASFFFGCLSGTEEEIDDEKFVAKEIPLPKNVKLYEMTREEYELCLSKLTLAMESLVSETKYMVERVNDVAQVQEDYEATRWPPSDDMLRVQDGRSDTEQDTKHDDHIKIDAVARKPSLRGQVANLLTRYESLSAAWLPNKCHVASNKVYPQYKLRKDSVFG